MLLPPVRLHLHLSSCPSCSSCSAGCCIASHHANASHPSAPPPLILPLSLSHLLSGWLSHHLSSHHHILSAFTSASHCATLTPLVWLVVVSPLVTPLPPICLHLPSHCAPLVPLVRLVVMSPLIMPMPPVRLHL
jgi:hypothetical protein